MATVAKRYGQSERSFHAFLKGNEPLGLRHYAERTSPSPQAWYRLPELYDYLSEGTGLRFRDLGAERRWAFAQTSVDRLVEDLIATQVLKTIAVLELVQSGLGIRVSSEMVAFALDDTETSQVTAALTRLVEQGVLIKRRKEPEYSLAVSDAVNIEALFDRAAKTSEGELIVSGISKVLSQRLVVANRHYDATGTIRTLGILVGSPEAWPEVSTGKSDEVRPDAWLKLVLVTKDSDAAATAIKRLQDERDPFKEDGLVLRDIEEILKTSGVGMPPYTKWGRTRSGCYFCFYQQKIEWVRLKEAHPDLYEKAKAYERPYDKTGNFFTWSQGESLAELEQPERMEQIQREHVIRIVRQTARKENATLAEVFAEADRTEEPEDDDDQGCLVCQL